MTSHATLPIAIVQEDKMDSTAIVLALLLAINGCFAAKIVMMPMFGRSHFMVLAKLAEELTTRGHEVRSMILITFCASPEDQ